MVKEVVAFIEEYESELPYASHNSFLPDREVSFEHKPTFASTINA
jgi:hypothetical protein